MEDDLLTRLRAVRDAYAADYVVPKGLEVMDALAARIEADARRIAKLEEALAALVLNIDAGGATLGAMRDARALLAPTGGSDGS